MSVTVDQEDWDIHSLKLSHLGQVLSRVRQSDRLIVRVLIDGEVPNLTDMNVISAVSLQEHTVFVETADPRQTALDTLGQLDAHLPQADALKDEAADLLRSNEWNPAMAKLSQCLSCWQQVQQAVTVIGRLLRIDLNQVVVDGAPLTEMCTRFASQLREIEAALKSADLVGLTDLLTYETAETGSHWQAALEALRAQILKLPQINPAVSVQSVA